MITNYNEIYTNEENITTVRQAITTMVESNANYIISMFHL